MSADPGAIMVKLDAAAVQLADLADRLTKCQRDIEPIEKQYDEAIGDHIAEWFVAYEKGDRKWPGEAVRVAIARRHIDEDLCKRYDELAARRKRLRERIDNEARSVSAWQSVLKALREEMGAVR